MWKRIKKFWDRIAGLFWVGLMVLYVAATTLPMLVHRDPNTRVIGMMWGGYWCLACLVVFLAVQYGWLKEARGQARQIACLYLDLRTGRKKDDFDAFDVALKTARGILPDGRLLRQNWYQFWRPRW